MAAREHTRQVRRVAGELKLFAGYARAFRRFLRKPLTLEDSRALVRRQLRARSESFLRVVETGIFGNPRSPYRRLLEHAGLGFGDVARLVRDHGVDGALARLYDEGVYVTLDEFKGRRPIRRGELEFSARLSDFDNTMVTGAFPAQTSGSRGAAKRVNIDLDLLTHEAAYECLFLDAAGLENRPIAIWHPVPPGVAGMKAVLRHVRHGRPPDKWFSHSRLTPGAGSLRHFLFTTYTVLASRAQGTRFPLPRHVPLGEAAGVARWLEAQTGRGTPAVLSATPSAAVRVCVAASKQRLDIAGTVFRLVGEPFTQAKADVIAQTGSTAFAHYAMAEVGHIGISCAAPEALDDVHFCSDKLGLLQREKTLEANGQKVGALYFTTLLPTCPKIMLNVESDDYAAMEERACGCAVGELGFSPHLHTIRSYEKLSSEGLTLLTSDVIGLVERVLPERFGGHATDYQFVAEEERALARMTLLVSPRVGRVDDVELLSAVLEAFRSKGPAKKMSADIWQDGKALRVDRREPHSTVTAKVPALHVRN